MENIRNQIEEWFVRFGNLVGRRPWFFLLGSILVVIAMVSQLPNIHIDTSGEGLLHKEDPALKTYETFRDQFGLDKVVIVSLDPADVFDQKFLHTFKEFHLALENDVTYLDEITSLINADYIHGDGDDLIVDNLIDHVPQSNDEMKSLKERVLSSQLYRNILISEDGSFTIIVIKPLIFSPSVNKLSSGEGLNSPPPLSEKEMSKFIQDITDVVNRFDSPEFPIYLGGDLSVEEVVKTLAVNTLIKFTGISTLIIIVIFAVLFRRISGVVLPLLVVSGALYSTLGLMAAFGIPITLNTTVLPSFILAVGIGDSVHILAIYYRCLEQNKSKAEAISFTLGHSGLAVVITSLTTAAGLLSFVSSGIAPIANLGIFAAIGVILALLFTLITLPSLLIIVPSRRKIQEKQSTISRLDYFLAGIGDVAVNNPWKVVIISTCLLTVALILAMQLKFSHNSLKFLDEDMPVRIATEIIDRNMKGSINVEVLIEANNEQGLNDPVLMGTIEKAQLIGEQIKIGEIPIGRSFSVTDMVKEINHALHGNALSYEIPQDRELIAQELLLYELGGGENLDKHIDRDHRKARISLRIPWLDVIIYSKLLNEYEMTLTDLFKGKASITLTGLAIIYMRTFEAIIRSMAESYLIAGVIVTLLMVILIGNLKIGLCSMAPNFIPIVFGLGFMYIAGIPLDYSTIMVGGIALGLAVDDTVHFMHNFIRYYRKTGDAGFAVRETLLTSGRAMLFTTIILGTSFFILTLAELKSTAYFGLITGFTICMALVADFLLAPAMMVLLARNNKSPDNKIANEKA